MFPRPRCFSQAFLGTAESQPDLGEQRMHAGKEGSLEKSSKMSWGRHPVRQLSGE